MHMLKYQADYHANVSVLQSIFLENLQDEELKI